LVNSILLAWGKETGKGVRFMFNEKEKLIEILTGVNSSKLNYYIELKKRNKEIVKQNNRLEIIYQLVRDINIDMSIEDIIKRVFGKLPLAVPCDFLGLAQLRKGKLCMTAMMPQILYGYPPIPRDSVLWQCIESGDAHVYDPVSKDDPFILENPALSDQISSMAVAPLFARSLVNGVLLVGSGMLSAYSQAELSFIQQLADHLAICIQNARLYEQVSQAKREWEATFNAVAEPIVLIDTNHNILRSNNRLPLDLNPAGDSGDNPKHLKCFQRLWGRAEKCENCPMDEIARTGKPVYERVQTDSGLILDICYYPVYNEKNEIFAVIHHMKDITEQVKMEVQLVQSAKLAAIGEMAAGVAHELNNPMTVIIGTAQLMLRETEEGKAESELLNDIVNCGLRCKKIIQNLLTFSRQDQYPLALTDINEEVGRVLSLIQYQINRNNIEIIQNLQPELPKITANGHHLQQVLINFLLNARDALDTVEREKKIEVQTSLNTGSNGQEQIVVTVKDNGIGIAPENLSKIFNPFYTSKEATRGTGLGLSVSLGIAEAHGGTITVESVPGEGSTFSMVLPVETS
jgi:two-component system NtrC family sensor kinase